MMASHRKGCTLPIAMAAALFLTAGQALAWDSISGNWCGKEDGCGKWHSLYNVRVELIKSDEQKRLEKEVESLLKVSSEFLRLEAQLKQMGMLESLISEKESFFSHLEHLRSRIEAPKIEIKIRYRDIKLKRQADFLQIIRGKIDPDVKWTIENGTVDERDGADVRVYRITARMGKGGGRTTGGAEPEIEGTITGKFKIKPDVFWEGTAPFKGTTAAGIVRQFVESGREGPIQDTIEIEATIDGGKHAVKGVLKGTVKQRPDGWRISGVYTPPPDHCSYAGERRVRPKWATGAWPTLEQSKLREFEKRGGAKKLEAVPRGGLRTQEQEKERDIRLEAQPLEGSSKLPIEASARKVAAPRPPEERLGKFERRIEGTINASKDTITVKLPPLPVLNYRCEVDDITSEKELKLVRQGSVQRIELSGSGGDRSEGGRGGAADRGRP
jgi:hypothetical protein